MFLACYADAIIDAIVCLCKVQCVVFNLSAKEHDHPYQFVSLHVSVLHLSFSLLFNDFSSAPAAHRSLISHIAMIQAVREIGSGKKCYRVCGYRWHFSSHPDEQNCPGWLVWLSWFPKLAYSWQVPLTFGKLAKKSRFSLARLDDLFFFFLFFEQDMLVSWHSEMSVYICA